MVLSDGTQIVMYEDIYDTASDVTKVTYQLHIPKKLTVTSITYSGDISPNIQSVAVTADENTGNYDAYTVVYTATPNISVTAYMSATTSGGTTTVSCHTNGHSGQTLHSHLHL